MNQKTPPEIQLLINDIALATVSARTEEDAAAAVVDLMAQMAPDASVVVMERFTRGSSVRFRFRHPTTGEGTWPAYVPAIWH